MIPAHIEQRIKDAAQIADVVGQFVTLKRLGRGYVALCPFHDERTPSFCVTPKMGIFKCFGCGKVGDAIAFLMEHKGMTYPDALRYLAAMYGIDTGETTGRPADFSPPKPKPAPAPQAPPPAAPPSFIPKAVFRDTLKAYNGGNNFAAFLAKRFGAPTAADLIGRYAIGSAKGGRVIFWYIDSRGNVRSGKTMQYDPTTGKRDRNASPTWAHTRLKLPDFNLSLCWYGEHLLPKRPGAPVAIVESEKSAILASLYLPAFVWLAAGGEDFLRPNNPEKWQALKGRRVVLFPDCDPPAKDGKTPFQRWSEAAEAMRRMGYNVRASDLLERTATDVLRAKKYDLADYLLKYDLADFHGAQDAHDRATAAPQAHGETFAVSADQAPARNVSAPTAPTAAPQPTDAPAVELTPEGYPACWDDPAPRTDAAPRPTQAEAVDLMTSKGWPPVGTWQPMTPHSAPQTPPTAAPDAWQGLEALTVFFSVTPPPTAPVKLDGCTTITDPAAFIAGHLAAARHNIGKPSFLPYLERLRTLHGRMTAPQAAPGGGGGIGG